MQRYKRYNTIEGGSDRDRIQRPESRARNRKAMGWMPSGWKAVLLASTLLVIQVAGQSQQAAKRGREEAAPKPDKAAAYYHYSLGHLYAELASSYNNRSDYFNKAIENYRMAMRDDPSATFL